MFFLVDKGYMIQARDIGDSAWYRITYLMAQIILELVCQHHFLKEMKPHHLI